METIEILTILSQDEDSLNQFKKNVTNADSLAAEIIAFSNGQGGRLFIGVDDDGKVTGLSKDDIQRLNQLVSNTASQNVLPAVNPTTAIATIENQHILVIEVPKGLDKPYQDKKGGFWVKSGADKRRATSREEIQRLFQASGMVHADVNPSGLTVADLDMQYFADFFAKRYGETLEGQNLPLEQTINNLNLGKDGELNLTGALLFSKNPAPRLPAFIVKAATFPNDSITTENYIDSRDINGKNCRYLSADVKLYSRKYYSHPGKPECKQSWRAGDSTNCS